MDKDLITPDEKDKQFITKKKSKIKTNININFTDNIVEVYVYESIMIIKYEKNNEGERQLSIVDEIKKEQPQILLTKHFSISEDFENVEINNNIFKIPQFFNRKTIKSKEVKTWEMIFYCVFEEEINAKIREILSKSKIK